MIQATSQQLSHTATRLSPNILRRCISAKSAIRKALHAPEHVSKRPYQPNRSRSPEDFKAPRRFEKKEYTGHRDDFKKTDHRTGEDTRTRPIRLLGSKNWTGPKAMNDSLPRQPNRSADNPIPYTTAASEFIYGTNAVIAALTQRRRKLYKLYMYRGSNREDSGSEHAITRLGASRQVPVDKVQTPQGLRMMDKMSSGRPHNGYVLEASPLPKLPVRGLAKVSQPGKTFEVLLGKQSREDELVNGTSPILPCRSASERFPLVLVLNGVLDPGNLGGIIRSALFFGVDAVAVTTNCTAPLSSVALKAAAGAAEAMPILSISRNDEFLKNCKAAGWTVFAADAPQNAAREAGGNAAPVLTASTLGVPLEDGPCLLLIGSEEKGLFPDVRKKVDRFVVIESTSIGEAGVESLNVSVATGVLCEAFLRRSRSSGEASEDTGDGEGGMF